MLHASAHRNVACQRTPCRMLRQQRRSAGQSSSACQMGSAAPCRRSSGNTGHLAAGELGMRTTHACRPPGKLQHDHGPTQPMVCRSRARWRHAGWIAKAGVQRPAANWRRRDRGGGTTPPRPLPARCRCAPTRTGATNVKELHLSSSGATQSAKGPKWTRIGGRIGLNSAAKPTSASFVFVQHLAGCSRSRAKGTSLTSVTQQNQNPKRHGLPHRRALPGAGAEQQPARQRPRG